MIIEAIMRCASRGCRKTKNLNPTNLLCPSCDKEVTNTQRRLSVNERQSLARAQVQDKRRDLNVSFASDISLPMAAANNYPSIDSLMVSNASNIASSDTPQQVPPQGNLGGSYTDSCSAIPSLNVATLQST